MTLAQIGNIQVPVPTPQRLGTRRWKGGRHLMLNGYVAIRIGGRYRYEHRVVMEAILGRPLRPHEHVHHRNGHKADNAPQNLELLDGREHNRRETSAQWRDGRRVFPSWLVAHNPNPPNGETRSCAACGGQFYLKRSRVARPIASRVCWPCRRGS